LLILSTACAGLFCGAALYANLVEHPARMSCGPTPKRHGLRSSAFAGSHALSQFFVAQPEASRYKTTLIIDRWHGGHRS
jgi:hypothetical protein